MSTEARVQYLLHCDRTDCGEAWAGGVGPLDEVVREARAAGWHITWDPDFDLCPEHHGVHDVCGLCGHEMKGVIAECGYAQANGVRLCHADSHSCYHRWTIYGERP